MFFQYISQVLSPGVDLHLTISKSADGLVVMLMPKVNDLKDPAQNRIVPLILKGQPQELDAKFFLAITQPVQKTSGLLLNMAAYEKQADAAAAASKAEKDKKDKAAKEAKDKKDKYDGFIKKADELEKAGDIDGTIIQLQQAKLHATDKQTKTVDERISVLKAKISQTSLFDAAPAAAPQQPAQQAQPAQTVQSPEAVTAPTTSPTLQEQPAATPQVQQMAQPAAVQPAGIQPNTQDFGIFGQPSAMSPDPGFMSTDNSACRSDEYAEYIDFESGMQPPVFSNMTQTGVN